MMKSIWLKGERFPYNGRVWTVTRTPHPDCTEPRGRIVYASSGIGRMDFHERNIKHKPEYRQAFLAKLALGVVARPIAIVEFPKPLEKAA